MSPLPRTSQPQQSQPESPIHRLLRAASALMTQRRDQPQPQPRRIANVRPDMPVTRDEECLSTHF